MGDREVFNTIPELISAIKMGEIIILVDDEDRENEGDLVIAAQHVTPESINFMINEARGLVCLSLGAEQVEKLQLPLMVRDEFNCSPNKTAFTVSIEASRGVTTGISAADRALTVKAASNPDAQPSDVTAPGHIFPIRAQRGGVLKRPGHTEGSVDLSLMAGLGPSAVICEVINDDGTMARVPELLEFAKKFNLKIGTIVDLVQYRLETESLVEETFRGHVSQFLENEFSVRVFRSQIDDVEHIVLQKGDLGDGSEPVMVRVESESIARNFLSQISPSGPSSISASIEMIRREERGVLVFLKSRSNDEQVTSEIRALSSGYNRGKKEMDRLDYGIGAQILQKVGVRKIRLISNKPVKRVGLNAFGLEIVEEIPVEYNLEENSDVRSTGKPANRRAQDRSSDRTL